MLIWNLDLCCNTQWCVTSDLIKPSKSCFLSFPLYFTNFNPLRTWIDLLEWSPRWDLFRSEWASPWVWYSEALQSHRVWGWEVFLVIIVHLSRVSYPNRPHFSYTTYHYSSIWPTWQALPFIAPHSPEPRLSPLNTPYNTRIALALPSQRTPSNRLSPPPSAPSITKIPLGPFPPPGTPPRSIRV